MRARSMGLFGALALFLVASLVTAAQGQTASGRLGEALDRLDGWLAGSPEGPRWREFLRVADLRTQLAKGGAAEPEAIWPVLGQFASGVPGLESAEFYHARRAIEDWLAELPAPKADRVGIELRLAKDVFIPRTANELAAGRERLTAALAELERRLSAEGPNGNQWKQFVLWDETQRELAKPSPDLPTLDRIYAQYVAGHEGLQYAIFKNVRDALRYYLITARGQNNASLRQRFQGLLESLAPWFDQYRKTPTSELAENINGALRTIDETGQSQRLITIIQAHLTYPNLFVRASLGLVAAGIDGPVNYSAPVVDNILGTTVYATPVTSGQITTSLVPADGHAELQMVFTGTTWANSVGYNGPVQIFSNSLTRFSGVKTLRIDLQGASTLPATSCANTSSTIQCIQANRRIVERVASRRAGAQQPAAEQEASRKAELRINQRADEQGNDGAAQINARYAERIRDPLDARALFPRIAQMSSTPDAVHMLALMGRTTELGSPYAPVPPREPWDLLGQVHQTTVNNAANGAFAGQIIHQERFLKFLQDSLGQVPQRWQEADDKDEPWTITLADRDPFSAVFENDLITFTLRGKGYGKGENEYPGMNVTAVYKPERTPQGVKFVRQGALKIVPPELEPGEGLAPRQQGLRDLLKRRFDRVFEPEIVPQPLTLGGNWKKAGQLGMVEAHAWAGWLVIGWRRIPGTELPPDPPAR